ncbi:transporter substrate-binding domain-containing protein [Vibrio sp. JC009]|uniref:substrate-binding periplasmic protein n=1 Tax=Vibrio sp. JC009 TaxID=2912314 RepID=UPI0023AFBF2E|nr:transporter substrate-binding domain-containing protein [Vibrio sp. JC009]WED20913.1 transporter substrate-binding domain-containing protein [Vibrio sp. JC009]
MERIIVRYYKKACAGVALVIFCLSAMQIQAEENINIAVGEFPPYCTERFESGGPLLQLVSEAYAAAGVKVNFGFFPWLRAYEYAKDGKDHRGKVWHGTIPWNYSTERAEDFKFSDNLIYDYVVFFYLKSKPFKWESIDDLKGRNVGLAVESYYPLIANAAEDKLLTTERVGNYDRLLNRLKHERVDVIPISKRVGLYYMNNELDRSTKNSISFAQKHFEIRYFHLLISRNVQESDHLLDKFNQGLRMIKHSGRYGEIVSSLNQYTQEK